MYCSGSNMPGYMPDAEPYTHETVEEAKASLIESIDSYMDSLADDELKIAEETLQEFKSAMAQECNVYIADYVFWITTE